MDRASATSRPATLTRMAALIVLIAVSAMTGVAAMTLLRGWMVAAAIGVGMTLWQPRWAIAALLTLLPIFGNKPGLRQVYALVLLGSSLNIGLALRSLIRWPRPAASSSESTSRNALFALLVLYGVASTLTLSTMPLSQIWHDSLTTLHNSHSPIAHLTLWLKAPETEPVYSLLSVILTWYAIALAFFIRVEITADPGAMFLFARAILIGLMMTLVVGLCDFYQIFLNLGPLRALDPVVNFAGQQRLQATFGHSGWFAEYLVMSLAYIAPVLASFRRLRVGIALVVALLLVAEFGLILTYQRGGWISHLFPLLTIWLAIFYAADLVRGQHRFRELLRRSLPKLAIAVPLTLGATLIIFLGVLQLGWFDSDERLGASSYAQRLAGLFDTSNRSMYIATGLKLGRLHPVLGAGSESFAYTYISEYLRPGGAFYGHGDPLPVLYGSAHNIYLQTLTGKGLVGLVLLLAMMGCVVIGGGRILLRQSDLPPPVALVLLVTIGSTLGLACYGVVQEVFYIQSIQYLIFGTFALAGSITAPWVRIRVRVLRWLWIGLAVLFVLHLAFEYGYPGRMRERWFWQNAVRDGAVLGITEIDSHGTRFRWSGARAFLDLPCSAKSMSVPVRSLANVPQFVEIFVSGRMIDRVALSDHNWRELKYPLPKSPWYAHSHCVELRVDPLWKPPGDTRELGVMVGRYSAQ